jgi:hypothetical protein
VEEGRGTAHLSFDKVGVAHLLVKEGLLAAGAALDGILYGDSIRLRAVKDTSGRY